MRKKENYFNKNLGIGIANAAWVATIGAVIIFTDASLFLLLLPIFFSWTFKE
jgi:hypothetical protein